MEIINVDNSKHNVNYKSDLEQFLTNGGINFSDLITKQYKLCCELFGKNFGPHKDELINSDHSVTFSSNNWMEALRLLPGNKPNHISWLTSVIREDHDIVKTLRHQPSGQFCFLLVRICSDQLTLVPIYFLFEKKTVDMPWYQSQFVVNYQEQVYLLDNAIIKQLFPQSEANQDQALVDSGNPHQHSIQRQNSKNLTQDMNDTQECGNPTATPRDQNMHQFQSQGSSNLAVTHQHHNSEYLVNYRDEKELVHGKRITDIVEYTLRSMDVPQGRITSRRVYDQIIDNMKLKLGHPTPHLANYENIHESKSIPFDLKSLRSKSSLLSLLLGPDNQVNTRRGQEMTREEVVYTASKEGQCLDIGVVYLKVDVETEKVKGRIWNSSKEKKTLHYEKMTFSMPRNKVQSIASQLN